MVILAAGTVGTNEILLRSRETNGLVLSDRLGKGFSSNGNYLWFVDYEQGDPAAVTNSAGVGVVLGTPMAPVGPSIQGIVDFRRGNRPMVDRVVFEDLAHPSALAGGVGVLAVADLNRAITLLACGHDTAEGEIRLENDEASVRWPNYSAQACRAEMAGSRGPVRPARTAGTGRAGLAGRQHHRPPARRLPHGGHGRPTAS